METLTSQDEAYSRVLLLNGAATPEDIRRQGWIALPAAGGRIVTFDFLQTRRERDELVQAYWRDQPMFRFFKSLGPGSKVLVVYAGDGGMVGWRTWGGVDRSDIQMYATGIQKGERFDDFADFDIVDASTQRTKFADQFFDAVLFPNIVGKINDTSHIFGEIARILRFGGKLYLDWPSDFATQFVPRAVLERFDILSSTLNYFDDAENIHTPRRFDAVARALQEARFEVVQSGSYVNDLLQQDLFSYGFEHRDQEVMTYALWLSMRFVTYAIADSLA